MRLLVATGYALLGIAMLLWIPEFADPLLNAVVLTLGIIGAFLAAAHWRVAGLGLMAGCWVFFGFQFVTDGGGIDSAVALLIAVGFLLAFAGARTRSIPLEVSGLVVAGIVQSYWLFAYMGPDNPYFLGNALFTPGALLAAIGAWRAGALLDRPAPHGEPETVK